MRVGWLWWVGKWIQAPPDTTQKPVKRHKSLLHPVSQECFTQSAHFCAYVHDTVARYKWICRNYRELSHSLHGPLCSYRDRMVTNLIGGGDHTMPAALREGITMIAAICCDIQCHGAATCSLWGCSVCTQWESVKSWMRPLSLFLYKTQYFPPTLSIYWQDRVCWKYKHWELPMHDLDIHRHYFQ